MSTCGDDARSGLAGAPVQKHDMRFSYSDSEGKALMEAFGTKWRHQNDKPA